MKYLLLEGAKTQRSPSKSERTRGNRGSGYKITANTRTGGKAQAERPAGADRLAGEGTAQSSKKRTSKDTKDRQATKKNPQKSRTEKVKEKRPHANAAKSEERRTFPPCAKARARATKIKNWKKLSRKRPDVAPKKSVFRRALFGRRA